MIEDAARAGAAVHDRAPDERAQLRVVHRRMRAERDEIVERGDARSELALESSNISGIGIVRVPSE